MNTGQASIYRRGAAGCDLKNCNFQTVIFKSSMNDVDVDTKSLEVIDI